MAAGESPESPPYNMDQGSVRRYQRAEYRVGYVTMPMSNPWSPGVLGTLPVEEWRVVFCCCGSFGSRLRDEMIGKACGVPGDIDLPKIDEPRERRRFICT